MFCDHEVTPADLAPEIRGAAAARPARHAGAPAQAHETLEAAVRDAEQRTIAAALAAHAGNLSRTAKQLGIERNTLKRKLAALGLR